MAKAFLDSNIVVYAFVDDPRAVIAERLLAEGADLSVQVLNEFANVARRKLGFSWPQIEEALDSIRMLARTIHPIDLDCHGQALALARRHDFSFYDALIVASALRGRCDLLYSEDMQDGMAVEELRIPHRAYLHSMSHAREGGNPAGKVAPAGGAGAGFPLSWE